MVVAAQPVVGVLALQGDVREHLVSLASCDVVARPVRRPEELDELDGIVIPGGESTTISRLLETFELLEPLKARIKAGMPAYGSCAGMIMLADKVLDGRPDQHQLGGLDVVVRRNAFGRQIDSFETELEITGVGPVHAVFIRAPWVESAGAGVEVLATVPVTPEAGEAAGRIVAVRQGNVLATAFHPELTGDERVHRLFVDMVRGLTGSEEK
ncbi:pyridoxal 5'-phosphate synthase subunit PdxT [Lentzea sp. NBRC 105346]|uniref:pyridoxal 5'-phosphate synthase glutaminase subunit PdxT n=1 Tax=Lentzea sp. NBRC 105346 TaxID=3032205 RepID=UPI0024A454A8|nr:pyridoxal 5'-phosphate synthase glutaminase subunit PdxT [Lentzea sp. NBRC 105346]GLZ33536.1 pyridoxal 5'-phosphate synthase subunit PdxT [Lentzea sp. NBRC 105346]